MSRLLRIGPWLAVDGRSAPRYLGSFRIVALALVILPLIYLSLTPATTTGLKVSVYGADGGVAQLFYDLGDGFTEGSSVTEAMSVDGAPMGAVLGTGILSRFRVDIAAGGSVRVGEAVLQTLNGHREERLAYELVAVNEATATIDEAGVTIVDPAPAAQDAYAVFQLNDPVQLTAGIGRISLIVCIASIISGLGIALTTIASRQPAMLYALACSAVLLAFATAMATPNLPSPHPDEPLHRSDASIFLDAHFPPTIDEESLGRTLGSSPYGVSYLFEWNVVYLIAGKAAAAASSVGIDTNTALRLFNVAVFAGLVLCAVGIRADAGYMSLLLVTPQAWYVFSYFNGDALPLGLAFIGVMLATMKHGKVAAFVDGQASFNSHCLLFVVVLGMLLVSKKNYSVVLAFLFLWQAISHLQMGRWVLGAALLLLTSAALLAAGGPYLVALLPYAVLVTWVAAIVISALVGAIYAFNLLTRNWRRPAAIWRMSVLYIAGLLVAAPYIAIDVLRNGLGSTKAAAIQNMIEQFADHRFKPSTILTDIASSYPSIRLSQKDVALTDMLLPPFQWAHFSYKSFFASFGYMEYYTNNYIYTAFGVSFIALIGLGAAASLRTNTDAKHWATAIVCAMLLVASSYLHSWTYDFQPQGRYVLALLPILTPLVIVDRSARGLMTASRTITIGAFLVAAWVFVVVGLANTAG